MVDGNEIACDQAPFIQNGRVFVPVRAVAEALSVPVKYDPPAQAVDVGVPPEGMDLITELPPYSGGSTPTSETVAGIDYGNTMPTGEMPQWNLWCRFKTLTFSVGAPDGDDGGNNTTVTCDGKVIDTAAAPAYGIKTYTYDVSGVTNLQIGPEFGSGYIIDPRVQ